MVFSKKKIEQKIRGNAHDHGMVRKIHVHVPGTIAFTVKNVIIFTFHQIKNSCFSYCMEPVAFFC